MNKYLTFTMSYVQWLMAGKPRRHPDRVLELYTICESCEHFDINLKTPLGVGGCKVCECHISKESKDFNKLVWPHEGCPEGKWCADVVSEK